MKALGPSVRQGRDGAAPEEGEREGRRSEDGGGMLKKGSAAERGPSVLPAATAAGPVRSGSGGREGEGEARPPRSLVRVIPCKRTDPRLGLQPL